MRPTQFIRELCKMNLCRTFLAAALICFLAASTATAQSNQNTAVTFVQEGIYKDPVAVGRPGGSGNEFQVWGTTQLGQQVLIYALDYNTCSWILLNQRRTDIQTDFSGNSTFYSRQVTNGSKTISWLDIYVLSGRTGTWQKIEGRRSMASCRAR